MERQQLCCTQTSSVSADTKGGTREKAGLGRGVSIWTGERICLAVKGLLCWYMQHSEFVFLLLCNDAAVSWHFLVPKEPGLLKTMKYLRPSIDFAFDKLYLLESH